MKILTLKNLTILLLAMGLSAPLTTFATTYDSGSFDFSDGYDDEDGDNFVEEKLALPPFPNPNQGDWFELYIGQDYKGSAKILLDSVKVANDGSIRYILNQRSAQGYDNISAEGFLCITGRKLLGSEGSKLKMFAYADLYNNRWIESKSNSKAGQWNVIGGKINSTDKVRRVLYETFCLDERSTQTDESVRQRIRDEAGFTSKSAKRDDKNSRNDND